MKLSYRLLVVTDIFGATPALQSALARLQADAAQQAGGTPAVALQIHICQPLSCMSGEAVFANDQAAYQAFVQQGGLDSYLQQVNGALTDQQPDLLLGFSAGAAALWCALNHTGGTTGPHKALLCYGGQIRQHHQSAPKVPVTCLWSDETHFDVVALQQQLRHYNNLRQLHWPQHHGFINPHSAGFDAVAAAEFWRRCQQWIAGADF